MEGIQKLSPSSSCHVDHCIRVWQLSG